MKRLTALWIVLFLVSTLNITTNFAQDVSHIYWTDHSAGKIQRANLDGTNVQDIVTGLGWVTDIALDMSMNKMYWTDRDTTSKIQRANLDGTNIETLVTGDTSIVKESIALDISGGKMYWTEGNKIQRASLDGTNIEDLVTDIISLRGIALELSQGKMYWADYGSSKIQRANLDGTNIEDVVTGLNRPNRIALDFSGGKIYWADESAGKIQCANFDGSHIRDLVLGLDFPIGIALDTSNGKMYWTDPGADKIQRASLDGTNIEDLVTIDGEPSGIALSIPQTSGGLRFDPNVIADQTFTVDTYASLNLPEATGGTAPYTYTLTPNLPAGLQFDPLDRWIGGTPIAVMPQSTYTYTATDAAGASAALIFTITVRDTLPPTDVYSHIYWTDWEWDSTNWGSGKIQRATLDGTNIEDIVTGLDAGVHAIALDVANQKMYWSFTDLDTESGKIRRANLDGTNIEDIVTDRYGNDIALDVANQKMYWADWSADKIQRATLDGTNIEDIVTLSGHLLGIALDVVNRKMYYSEHVSVPTGDGSWAEHAIIRRANLDGTNIEDIVGRGAYGGDIALDVAGGKIYYHSTFVLGVSASIRRANLDGTNDERIVTGYPTDIALDVANQKIYWIHDDDQTQKIQRANLDGTGIEDVIPTGLAQPTSIALGIAQTSGDLRFSPNVIADQTFTVGTAVNLTLPEVTGGTAPYIYTLTPQPPAGLYFDAATRILSGTPTTATPEDTYTYTATDTAAQTATLTFTITVTDTGPGPGGNLDVNGDGQINVLDLILIAVFYGTRGDDLAADVNADGVVNVLDFAAVAQAVDAAGGLPLQAVEAALLAAAAQAGDIEAIAGAPVSFNVHQHAWSKQIAYDNVATAFADVRHLAETGDMRLGKGVALLSELLQLLKEMSTIPETTALLPNYPNPFNPETWIPYHLATDAAVTVTIYNVRGVAIRTLTLGHQLAGVYESRGRAAYWDGRNQIGEPVASGLYFYTLSTESTRNSVTAGDFTATRKLLIAK